MKINQLRLLIFSQIQERKGKEDQENVCLQQLGSKREKLNVHKSNNNPPLIFSSKCSRRPL